MVENLSLATVERMSGLARALLALLAPFALIGCSNAADTASGGDDTTPATTGTTTSEQVTSEPTTSDPTTEDPTTEEPTTAEPTTEEPATEEPTGPEAGTVVGEGYTFALPAGWIDVTQQTKASNPQVDVAVAEPQTPGAFRLNFNTVTPSPIPDLTREQLVEQAETELAGVTNSKVESLPDKTFDGDTAIGQESTTDVSGYDIGIVQYLVVRDGNIYATTITYDVDRAEEADQILDGIIGSWAWTDS